MIEETKMKKKQTDTLILHYYPIRGVAQPIRILCYFLNIKFVDKYINKNQESEIECGFRIGLPMIQDGNLQIHQQISIINYLCMKAQKQNLMGLTPQHNAKISEILFKYTIQKKKIMSVIMQGLKFLENVNLNKSQLCEKTLKKLVQQNKFIEVCLKRYLKNKKYVFQYQTVLDFFFYQVCFYVDGFYREWIAKYSEYYAFIKFKIQFEKQAFFQKNKEKFESTSLFFPFSTPSLNLLVSESWKSQNPQNLFVKSIQSPDKN